MATQYGHRLGVEGDPQALGRLGADGAVWHLEPSRCLESLQVTGDVGNGTLTFPLRRRLQATGTSDCTARRAYPGLLFSYEFTDEFGDLARRQRYIGGACVEDVGLDAGPRLGRVGSEE